ncbi:MAG: hypothetical protein JJ850_12685 [Kordiimonadaceae bacterium]|nr:hypothetical protein [Kordiimonadaceae bacterium]MBO6570429.1 hypothetical protein [Kordiimonadaceae bacterium]MBO6965473.1 hypothetical protein [Kordiimonadaceae bacterium]
MDTIYFAAFCVFIFLIVVWGYKFDDYEEFNKDLGNKKFTMSPKKDPEEKSMDVTSEPEPEEDDLPRGNLL